MTVPRLYTYRICPWVLFGPGIATLDTPGFSLRNRTDAYAEPWQTTAPNATAALYNFTAKAEITMNTPEGQDLTPLATAAKPWLEIQVGGAAEDPDWRYAKAFSPKLGGYLAERLKTAFKYRAPAAALHALGFWCPPKGYVTAVGTHESAAAAARALCGGLEVKEAHGCLDLDEAAASITNVLEVHFTNHDVDGNALFGADSPHTLTAPNGEAPGAYWGRVRMRIEGPNQEGYLKNLPDWAYVSTVPFEFGGTRVLKAAEPLGADDGDAVETDALEDPASLGDTTLAADVPEEKLSALATAFQTTDIAETTPRRDIPDADSD